MIDNTNNDLYAKNRTIRNDCVVGFGWRRITESFPPIGEIQIIVETEDLNEQMVILDAEVIEENQVTIQGSMEGLLRTTFWRTKEDGLKWDKIVSENEMIMKGLVDFI